MALTLIGGTPLLHGVALLGASALAFYVGMRWPRHALKLAIAFLPLVLFSMAGAVGALHAAFEATTATSALPDCGQDARCWQRFEQVQAQAQSEQVRDLLGACAVPSLALALLALLVRRGRYARRRAEALGEGVAPRPTPGGDALAATLRNEPPPPALRSPRDAAAAGSEAAPPGDALDEGPCWWRARPEDEGGDDLPTTATRDPDGDARWMPKNDDPGA